MNIKLKKAILDYVVENKDAWQIVNNTTDHFHDYIYTPDGREYLIGGHGVSVFIQDAIKLIRDAYDD